MDPQEGPEFIAWITEHDKALPLDHGRKALAEGRSEFAKMSSRCLGAFVTFLRVNRLSVVTDELSVAENTAFCTSRSYHFTGQLFEVVKTAGSNFQLNRPGYLHRTHLIAS